MNNPINLAIGVAVLCCSFSCATSFTNTGLGDIFGGAGGLVTGAGGLVTGAGNAAGDAALAAADAVGAGPNLTQVSTDEECRIKCGGCKFGVVAMEEALAAGLSQALLDEAKAWCVGEGSGSDTKFGKPCCLPQQTIAELEAKGLSETTQSGPCGSKQECRAARLAKQRELCADPANATAPGCVALMGKGVEGYTIRKRVI